MASFVPPETVKEFKKFVISKPPEMEFKQLNYHDCALGLFYFEVLGKPLDIQVSPLYKSLKQTLITVKGKEDRESTLLIELNNCKTYKQVRRLLSNI